jgi:8-oxo-dGTP diphosphatase
MSVSDHVVTANRVESRNKPIIKVTCAIIERDGRVLAAQRSEAMSMSLKWEFPGGKLEDGEDPAACLIREIREELGVDVRILHALSPVLHDYGTWTIELLPFICEITSGGIVLHEHRAITWKEPRQLLDLDWPDADIPVIREYLEYSAKGECAGEKRD